MNIQIRDELLPADRPLLEHILRSCKFFREDEIAVKHSCSQSREGISAIGCLARHEIAHQVWPWTDRSAGPTRRRAPRP